MLVYICIQMYVVSCIFAEIDLYFTGDTPQLDVNSIHVEFESNMNDLIIECHLKGRDKVDCEYLQSGWVALESSPLPPENLRICIVSYSSLMAVAVPHKLSERLYESLTVEKRLFL